MILDIFIGIPILFFILLGVRDGIVRKLVAIIVLIGGLFLGQLYMHPVGTYLANRGWINSTDAQHDGFLIIFLGLAILQTLLYKILTGSYKIGGVADRIGGTVLGFIEGTIFVSSLLFIFALSGSPDRQTKRDSRFYKSVVNIAPQILDMTSSLDIDAFDKLKETGTPGAVKIGDGIKDIHPSVDSSAVLDKKKQLYNRDRNR
jgi:uncharacterized membrane protein required for colicin V production